jgi:hypothetical protein
MFEDGYLLGFVDAAASGTMSEDRRAVARYQGQPPPSQNLPVCEMNAHRVGGIDTPAGHAVMSLKTEKAMTVFTSRPWPVSPRRQPRVSPS